MKKAPRRLSAAAGAALARLRLLCGDWEGVEEVRSFGHPAFRVGSATFAVLDRYQDCDCLWLLVPAAERAALLACPGWFAAPYDPRRTALCVQLEAIDWRRLRAWLRISYALAAVPPAPARRAPRR